MIWWDVLFVFLLSLALVGVLVGVFGWRYSARDAAMPAVVFSFLVLFLGLWVASLWVVPAVGVRPLGDWLWLIVIGVLIALVIGAIAPPRRRVVLEDPDTETAAFAFSVFFWLLVLMLLALIVAGYALREQPAGAA